MACQQNDAPSRKMRSGVTSLAHLLQTAQRNGSSAVPQQYCERRTAAAANATPTAGKHSSTPRPPLINENPSVHIREKK